MSWIQELDAHSKALGQHLLPDPALILRGDKKAVPGQGEEILQVNVTHSPLTPFKIISKTNLTQFSHSPVEVHRPRGTSSGFTRCFWTLPPKRVVPPLKPPISLDATVSEFQRFLSRIAAHKEMRTLRANRSVSQDIVQFKPLRVVPWWPLRITWCLLNTTY
ncbi:hypothetical protein EMCRGX_G003259 [Ephydatia muelleri]